ncbi:AfsR/SARP family transcriptional regulator [Amycolatopsis sp. WAC 01375]|uniref:AfsR/SARP family transcriptional regulator n=1 Tax=Amycolatopsis sp. WAC 01375 TaxID=2203194 RepID=UPI0018F52587|nr:AfsR/SARP family transcriptional regulator [Amycolatopsis sp. WAC 01375]
MYTGSRVADTHHGSAPNPIPASPASPVRFTLLGPLELVRDGIDYAPTTPKLLQVLAMLVMSPGKIVHIDTIVQELWANDPPRSVRTTMHTYVYQLRKCIDENDLAPYGETMLATKPPGYVFRIAPQQVDVFQFQELQQKGRELQLRGEHLEAAKAFRSALDLWSGPPLSNVHCGPVLSAYAVDLVEQRRSTLHLRIEADIAAGMRHELIGELRSLVTANPLDEALHGQLIRVLGRSGRRSDALATYRQVRARLNNELGVEPCDELQVLHHGLLSEGEPA